MSNINDTLAERGARYGSFTGHAEVTQKMKMAMSTGANWYALDADQKECLEMIAHKIGRILNGDPNYHDSWHDIVGYTKLVADRLAPEKPITLNLVTTASMLYKDALDELLKFKNVGPMGALPENAKDFIGKFGPVLEIALNAAIEKPPVKIVDTTPRASSCC